MQLLFLLILSIVGGCQIQDEKVSSRTIVKDSADANANVAELIDLKLTVSAIAAPTRGEVVSNSAFGAIVRNGAEYNLVKITNNKEVESNKLIELKIDGIAANRIIAQSRAVDDDGKVYDWLIFDNEGNGKISDALIAQQLPDGQVQYLEEGRQWFESKPSTVSILYSTPTFLLATDGAFLNLIYRIDGKFEISRFELGKIARTFSVSAQHLVIRDDHQIIKLLEFSSQNPKSQIKSVSLEISDSDKINAVVADLKNRRILTFADASNKVYNLKRNEFRKIKNYAHFGDGSSTKTFLGKDGSIFSFNGEGNFEFLSISGG